MNNPTHYVFFSITPVPGWNAASRGTRKYPYLSIVPESGDVELRLEIPNQDSIGIDARRWVNRVAEFNRKNYNPVYIAVFDKLQGFNIHSEATGHTCLAWVLYYNQLALSIQYTCPIQIQGRDDEVIMQMLSSLRVD